MADPQAQTKPENQIAIIKRDTADVVAAKVHQLQQAGELVLPRNYAAANALKSAWLKLLTTKNTANLPVLTACTKDSIYNAMLDMVVQGLNPAKNQCYFIAYGDQLGCQRSYFGDELVARSVRPDAEVYYQVIYEGDDLETQIVKGKTQVVRHAQKFDNIDPAKIRGAYCVIEDKDGQIINSVVMTIAQIKQSWRHSKTYKPEGGTSFHHTQPDQACLRTVIRRCCKPVINSSSDAWLMQAVQREELMAEAEMDAEAAANANGELIDIEGESADATPQHDAETGEVKAEGNAQPPEQPSPPRAPAGPAPRQATLTGPRF